MLLETETIETIARNTLVSDILKYIEEHSSEYEEFLEEERKEEEQWLKKVQVHQVGNKITQVRYYQILLIEQTAL